MAQDPVRDQDIVLNGQVPDDPDQLKDDTVACAR
jgi:hypothetical protein